MNKFLKTGPAALLLACACAPCAWAQDAKPIETKTGEAVRERRVESAESRVEAEKSAEKSKETRDESGETDAEVEALRAQVESASNPSERGRLRLSLAGLLSNAGREADAAALLRSMLAEERFDPQLFYNTGNALAR